MSTLYIQSCDEVHRAHASVQCSKNFWCLQLKWEERRRTRKEMEQIHVSHQRVYKKGYTILLYTIYNPDWAKFEWVTADPRRQFFHAITVHLSPHVAWSDWTGKNGQAPPHSIWSSVPFFHKSKVATLVMTVVSVSWDKWGNLISDAGQCICGSRRKLNNDNIVGECCMWSCSVWHNTSPTTGWKTHTRSFSKHIQT